MGGEYAFSVANLRSCRKPATERECSKANNFLPRNWAATIPDASYVYGYRNFGT